MILIPVAAVVPAIGSNYRNDTHKVTKLISEN